MWLAGSVRLAGMARSTCMGKRRPTLPTKEICSDELELSSREMEKLKT